jgi:hypothetical protein
LSSLSPRQVASPKRTHELASTHPRSNSISNTNAKSQPPFKRSTSFSADVKPSLAKHAPPPPVGLAKQRFEAAKTPSASSLTPTPPKNRSPLKPRAQSKVASMLKQFE